MNDPPKRPDNVRRGNLIHRDVHGELTEAERAELAQLNAEMDAWLEAYYPHRYPVMPLDLEAKLFPKG